MLKTGWCEMWFPVGCEENDALAQRCASLLFDFIEIISEKNPFFQVFWLAASWYWGTSNTISELQNIECTWDSLIFEPARRRAGSPADFIALFSRWKSIFRFFLKTFAINGQSVNLVRADQVRKISFITIWKRHFIPLVLWIGCPLSA